jgi:hypothetical protein
VNRRRFLALSASAFAVACGKGLQPEPDTEAAAESPAESQPPAAGATRIHLQYISGSSTKVEQLIGDFDNQTKKPTHNLSGSRYGVHGTDLGNSFEHNGKVYFVFGDMNQPFAPDPIAFSTSTDPDGPLSLEFLTDTQGEFLRVLPPGIEMGPFEVNITGISLNGVMYVVVKTDHSDARDRDRSVLTRLDEQTRSFSVVRDISRLPGGHFIKMTLREAPGDLTGLPAPGPQVLMFGAGEATKSSAYLAAIPASSFASGDNTRYFAGLAAGMPRWSDKEADAAPLFDHPVLADISVIHATQIGLWLMLYNNAQIAPNGVVLRYASHPWGPWSEPQVIFNARRDRGSGAFIHDPREQPDDGLAGPVASRTQDPLTTPGAAYAPYMIERFTRVAGDKLTIQYVLSTWNPYVVVRMKSTLAIQRS